jgi:hypothetical protein
MNNRIQELIQQSMPEIDWKARHGVELNNGERLEHMSNWFDKFAELIVDECCLKLLDMDEKTKGSHNYYKHAAIQVKQHFGVEK